MDQESKEVSGLAPPAFALDSGLSATLQQVSSQLESHFGGKVFHTVVPRNVRLAEAPSHGMPGVRYDLASRGAHRSWYKFAFHPKSNVRP